MATSSAGTPMQIPEGLALSQTDDCDLSEGRRWTNICIEDGISSETCFMTSLWGRREDRSYMNKIYCETEVLVPSLESSDWTDALEDKYEYDHYVGPFLSKQTWFRLQSPRADKPRGSDPYLIREEYKKLIKDIQKHWTAWRTGVQEGRGTVLLGWPGIGKSIFLKIFLAHLLLDSKPVIMSDPEGQTFSAFDGGPDGKGRVRIVRTNFLVPFVEENRHFARCIVLYDSTSSLPTRPPYEMTTDNHGSDLRFWIVQATSPKESQWKAWKVRASAQIWCMMPWDWREIWIVSCGLMGMDTELAKKAYAQLGPGIRQPCGKYLHGFRNP
ncbi:hypothetical protein EWM64_g10026 [Hericium alpestre]|uniref:Uncharacterized protein n=1 Tax=Hericium alpestre TaxID=135208 RepID=A0A4Y9ZIX0_9AGAM|nr:hypothetical protein EWM64_g10026 [Hericium alpestre]